MYKNVIILGARKSGKSTLAKLIAEKEDCNIINLDYIIQAFEEEFPKENDENYKNHEISFIKKYIDIMNEKSFYSSEKNIIFEGNIPNLEIYLKGFNDSNLSLIALTYNSKDSKQFATEIKENASSTDMYRYLPIELIESDAKEFIEENNRINDILIQNGIYNYDVSNNREKVFNEILDNIYSITCVNSSAKRKN